jgi:pyridoxamine 5'-phosphate oxidase
LTVTGVDSPLPEMSAWIDDGAAREGPDGQIMVLSTAGPRGPSARCIVLRGVHDGRLRFATSLAGRKGADLAADPRAAAVLWWPSLRRQLVVEGRTERVSPEVADRVFAERPREAQLTAVALAQGSVIDGPRALEEAVDAARREYDGRPVARPADWTALDLAPTAVEFWREGASRRHERRRYSLGPDGAWQLTWLAP